MFTGCTLLGPLQKETGVTGLPSRRLIGFAVELVNYIVPTATEQLRSCGHPLRDGTFDGQKLYSSVVTFAGKTSTSTFLTLPLIYVQLCSF